jgi:predicted nucleic acid-binding protein
VTIYLDVSCLNRPFDDQTQLRIRVEAEAVRLIIEKCESGEWQQVISEMVKVEIDAISDDDRRERVRLLLPDEDPLPLSEDVYDRAKEIQAMGVKPADAVHVAAAELLQADVFLTCDDRLCKKGIRRQSEIKVRIANPLDWLKEVADDANP